MRGTTPYMRPEHCGFSIPKVDPKSTTPGAARLARAALSVLRERRETFAETFPVK
ncbi:hypothetical protein [Bradyrhizobium sp. USDA 4454]